MINFFIENNLFLILITTVIIIAVGCLFVKKLDTKKDRKLELIIGITAGVSIILVMYNLILSTLSNNRIEENRIAHITLENIQRNWLSPQLELSKAYPEGFFLYKSITPDADYGGFEPAVFDPAKRKQVEIASSIKIFQAVEDYLTIGSNDITGKGIWVNNFLMWLQSPILERNWKKLSFNYSKDTRELVERLIIEGKKLALKRKKNGVLTNHDYDEISNTFKVKFR